MARSHSGSSIKSAARERTYDTAVAGVDYQAASGTLEFAVGELSRTVTVDLAADGEVEPDETFRLVLSNPQGALLGDGEAIGTIRNDDSAITIADAVRSEGHSGTASMILTVSLAPSATQMLE